MRLIDADALIKHLDDAIKDAKRNGEICDYWEDDRSNLLYYLDNAPTVDAVEVVRCSECKWHKDFDGCFFSTDEVNDDGFCSYGDREGERREPVNQHEWMTSNDVAALLRVKRSTVWRWSREGKLKAFRFGRLVRFRACDVQSFMGDCEMWIEPPEK